MKADQIKDLIVLKVFNGDITGPFEYNDVREVANTIAVEFQKAKCDAWDEAWRAFLKSNPKNPYRVSEIENNKVKKKQMPPWIKADNGRLSIDTDHPEWIVYFKAFVTDPERLEQARRFVKKN